MMVILNQRCFVITSIIPALSIAPLTPIYMQEWNRSLTDVSLLVSLINSNLRLITALHAIDWSHRNSARLLQFNYHSMLRDIWPPDHPHHMCFVEPRIHNRVCIGAIVHLVPWSTHSDRDWCRCRRKHYECCGCRHVFPT